MAKRGIKKGEPRTKISDADFWLVLREAGGLFSRAVRMFESELGVEITRQAVSQRAKKSPELLADIDEETLDITEETIIGILRSSKTDTNSKLKAAGMLLSARGKKRGYGVGRTELTGEEGSTFKIEVVGDASKLFHKE